MKKSLILLLFAVFLPGVLSAAVLNKKSNYTIVYGDKLPPQSHFNRLAAEDLQTLLNKAVGKKFAITAESKFSAQTPAFFIGNTLAAAKANLLPRKYERWEHHIRILNGSVYLFGADIPGKVQQEKPNPRAMELGSYKAMITFMEQFAGAVFCGSPNLADSVLRQKQITFPDDFRYDSKPFFHYNIGRYRTLPCDMGQNGFYAPWYGSYGGHSYPAAVPKAKLFKTHPEYFAVQRGKRDPGNQNQLCLSNKEVQKLIYQEVLTHLDQGYDMVQLAQSDGFCPCECEQCRNLFGIKPSTVPEDRAAFRRNPAWGEKIWILHKRFADRLLKDRPGKKVCIIAYGPTQKPPQSFREFPDNVMIELAPFNDEVLESWKGYKVPSGFVVYLYNWGSYKAEGFFPKMSWEDCRKQVQSFYDNNIRGIYRCGHGELYGTEGITYYIWGQLLQNPKLDIDKAVKKYCCVVYPGAEKEMEQFYRLLNERLQLKLDSEETDWNDPDLLNGKKNLTKKSWEVTLLRYPPEVLERLETLLSCAEKKLNPKKSWMLRLTRLEFNYQKSTARTLQAMEKFRKIRSAAEWQKAQKLLVERQKLIDALPFIAENSGARWNRLALFGAAPRARLLDGGRLRGPLGPPFCWNNKWYAEHQVQPFFRTLKVNDTVPQYLIPGPDWIVVPDALYIQKNARILCKMEKEHLKVIFILANENYKNAKNYQIQFFLDLPDGSCYFVPARFRSGKNGIYKLKLSNAANKGGGIVWKPFSQIQIKRTVPAPGVKLNDNEISVELDLDLKVLGHIPAKGEVWGFNAKYKTPFNWMVWEHNGNQHTWHHVEDGRGKLVF